MWDYPEPTDHSSPHFLLFTHMSYSSNCIPGRPSTFVCVCAHSRMCLSLGCTHRPEFSEPGTLKSIAGGAQLPLVVDWHPSSLTGPAPKPGSTLRTVLCSQEIAAQGLLSLP